MNYQYRRNDLLVLGRLMSDERRNELEPSNKNVLSIYQTNDGDLYATIEPISKQPDSFPADYYETPVRYLYNFGLNDLTDLDFDTQCNELLNFFSNRLILFYPYQSDAGTHNNIDRNDLSFVPIPLQYDPESKYCGLPLYASTLEYSAHDIEAALSEAAPIPCQHDVSYDREDNPAFVIIKTDEEEYRAYGPLAEFTCQGTPPKQEIVIMSELHPQYITIPDTILLRSIFVKNMVFMTEEDVQAVKRSLLTQSTKVAPQKGPVKPQAVEDVENIADVEEIEEAANAPTTRESKDIESSPVSQATALSETQFIERFIAKVKAEKYVYQNADLVNFHVAMKSSGLVILAGMSGIGKSRIVQLYAQSLGLAEEQVKIIPVRPFWTDDADVLGYLDTTHMLYRPAECGLVDTLIEATRHPDKLYIICFDEMNLARVEHYFSQFISVLENDVGKRSLQLYNPSAEADVCNQYDYPAHIEVKDNVLFVGTVNVDESTFAFSDKILDRSNVIHLHRCSFQSLKALTNASSTEDAAASVLPVPMTAANYNAYRSADNQITLSDEETAFIDALDQKLSQVLPDGGIGYRIFCQMDEYLKSLPPTPYLSHSEAFDLQIAQRILTKLRGPEQLLAPLFNTSGNHQDSYLRNLFAAQKNLSAFQECQAILVKKENELIQYGYTL